MRRSYRTVAGASGPSLTGFVADFTAALPQEPHQVSLAVKSSVNSSCGFPTPRSA